MDYLASVIADLDAKIEEAKKLATDPEMAPMAQEEIKKLEEEKTL